MGWFLFIDESGQDRRESPYEVLAGVAVEDRVLWQLIQAIKSLQEVHFGLRLYDAYGAEAKGKTLLNRKTFRLAAQRNPLPPAERAMLANAALTDGTAVSGDMLSALGQAKVAYVADVLKVCRKFQVIAFASIIPNNIVRPTHDFLRKDYAFLFERFFHFLNGRREAPKPIGTIVFDEIEKQQSQILLEQMERYFLHTRNGQTRSRLILPEPLFVHSDLTSMIQVADLVAYIISWGVRLKGGSRPMTADSRAELNELSASVCRLRYHATTPGGHDTWGFYVVGSLNAEFQD